MDTAKPNQEAVQEYEEVWRSFEHNTLVDGNIPPSDILLLAKACEGDPARLRRYLKRCIFGESTAPGHLVRRSSVFAASLPKWMIRSVRHEAFPIRRFG